MDERFREATRPVVVGASGMTDPSLERLDAIELAVTQLADAVERLMEVYAKPGTNKHLEPVREQIEAARRFIGTDG